MIPGATAKVLSKGIKGAKELALVAKNLKTTEQTFALEVLAQSGKCDLSLANMMAKTATRPWTDAEIAKIKAYKIPSANETSMRARGVWEDFQRCRKAEIILKFYREQFFPESEIRKLIHQAGMPTFPRPAGIPENYRVMISEKGAGMIYVHPENPKITIRVMPGKPHSQHPAQQKPYVIQRKDNCYFDKHGNVVSDESVEAHIPIEEFIYKE